MYDASDHLANGGLPAAPPQRPGRLPVRRTVWPTVLGVIAIVYAGLMMLCNVSGFIVSTLYKWLAGFLGSMGQPDRAIEITADVADKYQAMFIVYSILAIGASLWLLLASISLVKRRPGSSRSIIAWSIVEFVLQCASIGLQVVLTKAVADVLRGEGLGRQATETYVMAVINGCSMLVVSIALPIFMLIWFSRAKIKAEIASWDPRIAD